MQSLQSKLKTKLLIFVRKLVHLGTMSKLLRICLKIEKLNNMLLTSTMKSTKKD
jgi:hypothetical protein